MRAYKNHEAKRDIPEAPVIWHEGTTVLRDYNPLHPECPAVLVIPSLINRFTILDLDLAPSFLRSFAERSFRPLVVDWNAPGYEERDFGLTEYVKRLARILETLPGETHIVGYCMGGLLALALAALKPERTKTLTLMATPWDFHKPDPDLGAAFAKLAAGMEPALKELGHMPVDIIQGLFAALQPMHVPEKFCEFAEVDMDSMAARKFVLVEDWLNEGVPLTANVARECLSDWYGENYTAKYDWHIDGKIIDPRTIVTPSYLIVPGRDRIVPPASALPLAKLLPHAALHEPMMGHIGMMASRHAPYQVWAPLFHWLEEHK